MMETLLTLNWLVIGQIILIDVLLGGDNAIVIALACRRLSPEHQRLGILWGTVGAILARIVMLALAAYLLDVIFVKLIGGVLLIWIAFKLLREDQAQDEELNAPERLFAAIRTIIVADVIMSFDNVIGVAAAVEASDSEHPVTLMVLGILVSIPFVVWGSRLLMRLIERFPSIVLLGAAMLAYIAAVMICSEAFVVAILKQYASFLYIPIPMLDVKLNILGLLSALSLAVWSKFGDKKS